MPGGGVAFMPAAKAKESLPEREPSFFKSKVREWWDAILAVPPGEELVSDIVDLEVPKRLTEQLNRVIESVFCSDDAKKLTSIVLDWARHNGDKQLIDTLRTLLRECERVRGKRKLRKVLSNFFLALPDPWQTNASSVFSALTATRT